MKPLSQSSGAYHTNVRLLLTQSARIRSADWGRETENGSCLAPRIRYAFIFSPYRKGSLFCRMPHCMSSAQLPLTKRSSHGGAASGFVTAPDSTAGDVDTGSDQIRFDLSGIPGISSAGKRGERIGGRIVGTDGNDISGGGRYRESGFRCRREKLCGSPRIAAAGIHRSIIPSMTDRASAVKTRHLPKYSPAAAADRWQFPDTDYKGGKSVVH